ncbi:peroxide stress protein YaaA [Gilliamella sp. Pra-s65]|uniref:peroxide stress protein YaaA n=1 Tax=unclassified Gilliamella TaxID=2685620 RepID=UPI001324139A|nr:MULTISPECIES: peroxide stress protein YaaA [unclassified Gilliamella]MWN31048.1 peroxide stress protein YaaA [Gilliamella sp. Pra-s60]MWN89797.1 peroxide stress protein YaaA [Gilliamella sp. Pra-s65]MWP28387.1 peroxide stress protein YaaA [Gilliamella sp. Pra-s54]MWP46692.1 peroxide stress protein YaaA [Gilliamella sp. Pas-s27]MWP72969.1 peroxide stress protein YaaA [Gilliamella sp. Pra-s52]
MLTVISPAKTLDYQSPLTTKQNTLPQFMHQSENLIEDCKKLSSKDLATLMSISPKLAELNYERFQTWHRDFNLENARQAILAFKGDVYEGLHVEDFTHKELEFAQNHLRILSGLYGILRPLDLIQPYRLEMGIRLKNGNNSNLYQFWGDQLTNHLNGELTKSKNRTLINLASNEYFKVIKTKQLNANIIQPIFLDQSKNTYKVISFYAKKARGLMSRYIIKNSIENSDDIKSFNLEGYQFDSKRSTDLEWYFIRNHK